MPLYDSYTAARLGTLVSWHAKQVPSGQPSGSDREYRSFCVRFLRLYDACHEAGRVVTVRGLDNYLWQVPVSP